MVGGINSSTSNELIADNEMQICNNFEYTIEGNKLKTRGGLSMPLISFPANIMSVYYDYEMNAHLVFLVNREVYSTNLKTSTVIGTLSGVEKPMCCKFGNKVFIASGDKLQVFDQTSLITIASSPLCNIVYERFGRVAVARAGSDYIYYSAIGSADDETTSWNEDVEDDSSMKPLEVGYQDGGNIVAIIPLATDVIVFKSNGKVFQVANEYPDWSVYEVGRNADVNYRFAVINIGNEVVFLNDRGLMTLQTVQNYGNIHMNELGEKFNNLLSKNGTYHPTLWNIKRKKQLLIRSVEGNTIWAYHYALNAATTLTFHNPVTDIIETPSNTLIAIGNALHTWSDDYINDINNRNINCKIVFKNQINPDKFLIKEIETFVTSLVRNGQCLVVIGRLNLTIVWEDGVIMKRIKKRTNYSLPEFTVEFSSSCPLAFNHIIVEVADI